MLNTNHPDDETLSAHAAGDADTSADPSLDAHLASCGRCGDVVSDLGMLRSALADLPDIAPHRPLRLIPPVDAERHRPADGLGQWVRRLFGPALTAGAALAMVGLVGTALPSLEGMASSGAQSAPSEASRALTADDAASDGTEADAANEATASDTIQFSAPTDGAGAGGAITGGDDATAEQPAAEEAGTGLADAVESERSPWPMVLFSGVALMIAAALLRWILAAPAD